MPCFETISRREWEGVSDPPIAARGGEKPSDHAPVVAELRTAAQ